jgi:uncharacterized protein
LNRGLLNGLSVEEMFGLFPELDWLGRMIIMAPLCLLSSMHYSEVLKGPAEFFISKMKVHWNFNPVTAVTGNFFPKNFTRSYVDAFASPFRDGIAMNAEVRSVERNGRRVVIRLHDGTERAFDRVIFACNADQALSLLEKPTDPEKRLLGAWRYKEVMTVVHRDPANTPARVLCQPWTLVHSERNGGPHFSILYCSWLLSPSTSRKSEYFAILHPAFPIREDLVDCRKTFRIPLFNFASYLTIRELPSLNGTLNSYYCGSHFGFGLHGAAVDSAIDVARRLGVAWK